MLTVMACGTPETALEESYDYALPATFPGPIEPEDNPTTAEKVALGRSLFHDTRLSINEKSSCASCHLQSLAFTDGLPVSEGTTGEFTPRGSMALGNVAYGSTFTWANPEVRDLESQARGPLLGERPVELGLAGQEALLQQRLGADSYPAMFEAAFPNDPDALSQDRVVSSIVKAIAAFERTMISASSPFDAWEAGDSDALSSAARSGYALFFSERFECFHCHGGFNFSSAVSHKGQLVAQDFFHNNGLYNIGGLGLYPEGNQGVYEITQDPQDRGMFKPPTLRNIALTAPYMHDGSVATLAEVIDMYAAGGRNTESGDHAGDGRLHPMKSPFVRGIPDITPEEKADLIAFLESLTDGPFLVDPRFSDPFAPENQD